MVCLDRLPADPELSVALDDKNPICVDRPIESGCSHIVAGFDGQFAEFGRTGHAGGRQCSSS